ncbi:ribose-5-phosphate isomerase RpiA [Enterovirga aerilata]|uniref:Ribose-5-phosphate isomerase A n=1 Tax=Enterovirga aerilata TaxID=2730920 RepID=A0A849HY59_9HYPH|nr:ribose-5-phosphate isomerase RpiA [Enterovirga sp. DB1703]NNM72466.1 ribose-5-phosphate isomerase RpiA [Enterovirga sp. DB1703]
MTSDDAKRRAAERACDLVQSGMKLGLGTGSTAALFVAELGRRRIDILGVPTSEATRRQAEALGIRLATLDDEPELDLTVDGADELDPVLNLIKGGGGALLREKLVAAASRRMVVIADSSKRVPQLGRFPLPVEVVSFGLETTRRRIAACLRELELPADIRLRRSADDQPFRTDGGNVILDLRLGEIPDPHGLAAVLKSTLGVVEHGLFVAMASLALIGGPEGVIEMAGN